MRLILALITSVLCVSQLGFAVTPDPNPGLSVNVLSYFPTESMCTANNGNPTRWLHSNKQNCPNADMYYQLLGSPAYTSETMYVEAGFMKFVEHNDYNAQVNITFRDVASGRKGFRWMPTSFSKRNGYQGYIAPWVEEHWVPFCVGNNHEPNPPTTQGASYLMDFGVLPNWLTDNRANPDFAGTVDVYYVSNQSLTFGNETYYFGKYWSERQQKWIGLGTIRFTNDSGKDDQNRVIVDCTAALQCATCPDP